MMKSEMSAKVYVLLWFDTEDYVLAASDDAALRICRFLTGQGIQGTFKMVGEKARVLAGRKRRDVINALRKHEIGYHTDFHSRPPTPAQYLSNLNWDDGVAEFDRREKSGFDDVGGIFGARPSCYGQPGGSWGPQAYGAMRNWGVNTYLDAGRTVDLDGRPCFYCGIFNLLRLTYEIRAELGNPADLEEAKKEFAAARQSLLEQGGGIVSIVYHPCEFIHREFWDAVNFSKGANPPREKWRPPRMKSKAAIETAFANFEGYVRFMASFPEVAFLTAADAAKLYPDRARGKSFPPGELRRIAAAVGGQVDFQAREGYFLAASEILYLLSHAAAGQRGGAFKFQETPLGPTSACPRLEKAFAVERSQFERTVADVADFMRARGRVPSSVWLGGRHVSPESFMVALAREFRHLPSGKSLPLRIEIAPAKLATAERVASDSPRLWGWPIFPDGFSAPAMMDLAKRQAWTLKPA